MCGVVGIWNKNKVPVEPQLLTRMRDAMHFRGPDDSGIWIDGPTGLGHRRLSVIDLSTMGHQPMMDEATGNVIVYNGEVYNFQEIKNELAACGIQCKSHSDSEVILKSYRKWGKECVHKFSGMFAFAIFDPQKKGIFIARDRIGIKPLYYYDSKDLFMFASRLTPLLIHPDCPRDIDDEALGLFLELGFIPAPWSILKGVKKLQPGHSLWIDASDLAQRCYWDVNAIPLDYSLRKLSQQELIARLDGLLHDAVKSHLVSDVSLGTFLSGGMDSSLITALVCRHSPTPPKTFTIGFQEKQFDESSYARRIASYLGTNHHEKIMKSNDLLSLLDENTRYYDEPFADYSSLPTMMVSRFARQTVTVALSGDGGDELFAGYHSYSIPFHLRNYFSLPHKARIALGRILSAVSSQKYKIVGQSLAQKNIMDSFVLIRSIAKEGLKRNSLLNTDAPTAADLFRQCSSKTPPLDEIAKLCRIDLNYYLPDDILQKTDVASMSASLEARVPLLDHRIIEFSQSLPLEYKLRLGSTKWLLSKVLEKYIPKKIFQRPKKGFVPPVAQWLRGELKEMLLDELSPTKIKQTNLLNPQGVQDLIAMHLRREKDTHQMLWAVLTLMRWHNHFLKH